MKSAAQMKFHLLCASDLVPLFSHCPARLCTNANVIYFLMCLCPCKFRFLVIRAQEAAAARLASPPAAERVWSTSWPPVGQVEGFTRTATTGLVSNGQGHARGEKTSVGWWRCCQAATSSRAKLTNSIATLWPRANEIGDKTSLQESATKLSTRPDYCPLCLCLILLACETATVGAALSFRSGSKLAAGHSTSQLGGCATCAESASLSSAAASMSVLNLHSQLSG